MTALERAARAVREIDPELTICEADEFARAVLMAVREPGAGFGLSATKDHDTHWHYEGNGHPSGPCDTFTAMIDAILNEKDTAND